MLLEESREDLAVLRMLTKEYGTLIKKGEAALDELEILRDKPGKEIAFKSKQYRDYLKRTTFARMKDLFFYFKKVIGYNHRVWQYSSRLKKECAQIEEACLALQKKVDDYQKKVAKSTGSEYFDEEYILEKQKQCKDYTRAIEAKERRLVKLKDELEIKQEELELAIRDTNLAKSSYYRLTDMEMELFETQRDRILRGIEQWGNITLAIKNDAKITMKPSTIMHYAAKHQQFKEDIEIARQVFRDNLDSEVIDRALNGTKNPVFQKGEYIGDYAVKDNKLLLELAKAKLPKTYNPKVVAENNVERVKGNGGTTINILSFEGADETKYGYAKNVGIVTSVDESGKVVKIQNKDLQKAQKALKTKKMLDFYKNKEGAEIIDVESKEVTDGEDK